MNLIVIILLFLQSLAPCIFLAYGAEWKGATLQLPGEHQALTLQRGDDPCTVLRQHCIENGDNCFNEAHDLLTTQLANNWTATMKLGLQLTPSLFTNCERFDNSAYGTCIVGANNMPMFSNTQIIGKLLLQLETIPQSDTEAMKAFELSRNEVKFTAEEKLELYSQAILLHPNSKLIVSQLGLSFLSVGLKDYASHLFQNAIVRGIWPHILQRPEWNYIPGLTAKPWHNTNDFAFISKLEAGYEDIKEELLYNMRERRHILFAGEQENLNTFNGGDWTALKLKVGLGYDGYTQTAMQYFPKTVQILKDCEEDFLLVKFSAIKPGTHIQPHTGPSNRRLRSHLAMIHSGGARMRCGEQWKTWEEGKAFVLDSSWEHEVVHEGDELRVVLISDIWHPELPLTNRVL